MAIALQDFKRRSDTDFDQVWEQQTYRLSRVTDVDLIMSYWMGEPIAHTIAVSDSMTVSGWRSRSKPASNVTKLFLCCRVLQAV